MIEFDLKHWQSIVHAGAQAAFEEVRRQHQDKDLFGYCLFSDESAMTLAHVVGYRENGWPSHSDDEFWIPQEWQLAADDQELERAGLQIQRFMEEFYKSASDDEFENKRNEVLETCVAALAEIRKSGFFGDGSNQALVLFDIPGWTEEDIYEWAEVLNPESTLFAYREWISRQSLPPVTQNTEDPDTGTLSSEEQLYLCLATRGRLQQLQDMQTTEIRDFVIHEALVLAA